MEGEGGRHFIDTNIPIREINTQVNPSLEHSGDIWVARVGSQVVETLSGGSIDDLLASVPGSWRNALSISNGIILEEGGRDVAA